MRSHSAAWIAGAVLGSVVVLAVLLLRLRWANNPSSLLQGAFSSLVLLAFATVAALIVWRQPQNRIGWLLAIGIVAEAIGETALEAAVYALIIAPGSLLDGEWLAWLGAWLQGVGFTILVTLLPLIFPTGRLPSPRWRPVGWLAVANLAVFTVVAILGSRSLDFRFPFMHNPLGIEIPDRFYDLLYALQAYAGGITMAATVASVIFRFRGSRGVVRQQLKWFALAAIFGLIVFAGMIASGNLAPALTGFSLPPDVQIKIGEVLFNLAVAAFPPAIGIAILRYRLYDIDRIIHRALVYGAVTATLALVY
jgi:hypothetical protein